MNYFLSKYLFKADRFEPNRFKKWLLFGLGMQNGFKTGSHKARQTVSWKIALINTKGQIWSNRRQENAMSELEHPNTWWWNPAQNQIARNGMKLTGSRCLLETARVPPIILTSLYVLKCTEIHYCFCQALHRQTDFNMKKGLHTQQMCNFSSSVMPHFIQRLLQDEIIFHRFLSALFILDKSNISTEPHAETCRFNYKFCCPQMVI